MATYHLLKDVPDVLRVNKKGELYCVDGRDVKAYLKERFAGHPADTPLTILPSETAKRQNELAWLVPHLALAC
ncbi:MAG TPA: hypothetical protein VNS88_16685 [Nitrospiraceae bacterium]|nr:hypothetical protein [Nitrospiraceae bacterium]